MTSDEIKQRALNYLYSKEKLSRREFCIRLKMTAPENSDEWKFFNKAESLYEMAETYKNSTCAGHKARNRARYWYKRAWALRELRENEEAKKLNNKLRGVQ